MIDFNPETTQLETLDIDISYLAAGMEVIDENDWVGVIDEVYSPHAISVHYVEGELVVGASMCCCVPGCHMHMLCFLLIS